MQGALDVWLLRRGDAVRAVRDVRRLPGVGVMRVVRGEEAVHGGECGRAAPFVVPGRGGLLSQYVPGEGGGERDGGVVELEDRA